MQRTVPARQVAALVAGFDVAPAYRGLAKALRVVITDGRIPSGVRLPSERQLMEALGVSRATVTRAYAELRDHGFLLSRQGSGWVTTLPEARGRRGDHLLPVGDQPLGKITRVLVENPPTRTRSPPSPEAGPVSPASTRERPGRAR
jgi:DNA-binding transcriptional MocR family regulator